MRDERRPLGARRLTQAEFRACDLALANMEQAEMREANLMEQPLTAAQQQSARLHGAKRHRAENVPLTADPFLSAIDALVCASTTGTAAIVVSTANRSKQICISQKRASEGLCQRRGNAFAVGAQRSACRTRGRKVVTLAADANGGLYVDGMRAHCRRSPPAAWFSRWRAIAFASSSTATNWSLPRSCRASRRTPS